MLSNNTDICRAAHLCVLCNAYEENYTPRTTCHKLNKRARILSVIGMNLLEPVVQKQISLTLGYDSREISQQLVRRIRNIASQIFSGSIYVLVSEVLKETGV